MSKQLKAEAQSRRGDGKLAGTRIRQQVAELDRKMKAEDEELARRLEAVPGFSESLRKAPTQIKRQVFKSFDLQIHIDKREGRIEASDTVSEKVAKALDNSEGGSDEGPSVSLANIAGSDSNL